jgi:hypothetical protein
MEWLRHYLAPVVLFIAVGASLAAVWGVLQLRGTEMWSIVVDTQQALPARQLGVVAETLFRAESTYQRAMSELRMEGPPSDLYDIVELKAVPDSRLLIVTAHSHDRDRATQAADAMAKSLAQALDEAGYANFEVLGTPQPAPVSSNISVPVLVMIGAVFGTMIGLAVVTLVYRGRRPVLALRRAAVLVGPAHIVSMPGRARFLGMLRTRPPQLTIAARQVATTQLAALDRASLVAPGVRAGRSAELAANVGLPEGTDGLHVVIACDPSTTETSLLVTMAQLSAPPTLLWVD